MNNSSFNLDAVQQLAELDLVVAFTDLTGFMRVMQRAKSPQAVAHLLETHFELVGETVKANGGRFVKCLGDATLTVFPESAADAAVRCMVEVKKRSDEWFADQGYECPLRIGLDVGPVICGPFGPTYDKRFDVLGHTVNTAVTLATRDISLTPQVFRKLEPETRKLFKKHTPPVRYIPVDSPHRD